MARELARARWRANTSRWRARLRGTALIAAAALLLAGEPRLARAAEPVAERSGAQLSAELVLRALSLLGVHYRFSVDVGIAMGTAIGKLGAQRHFLPLAKSRD